MVIKLLIDILEQRIYQGLQTEKRSRMASLWQQTNPKPLTLIINLLRGLKRN